MKFLRLFFLALALGVIEGRGVSAHFQGFEQSLKMPEDWTAEGAVKVESGDAFEGKHALVLEKEEASLRAPTTAKGPILAVSPGTVVAEFAGRSNLTSMDNSYNGTLALEFLDKAGASLGSTELGAWYRQSPWKQDRVEAAVPDGAVSARFVAALNKETPGRFWLDSLQLTSKGATEGDSIRRMVLRFPELDHLLFPDSPRVADVEVWSEKELAESERDARFFVRDYWGAEQGPPIVVKLVPAGKLADKPYFFYRARVDLAAAPLRVGRYYELHGEIDCPAGIPFTNSTSFAILPEAETNQYAPNKIPFTSRTWDQRFAESPQLTKRLGIRFCNAWGQMTADPAKVGAAQIELAHELGLGVVTSSPALGIEARAEGWRDLLANDGALIRQGVRNFLSKYGSIKPMVVNLGNEPHSKGEDVKTDVEAYRIVYQEIKKIDPSIFVVGTSVGPEEAYFQAGFGQWLDAYDFHSYEDPESVRTILSEKYPALFQKYGHAKPIWSTEIGMNSQGMTRQAVAGLLYRKFANFFAGGGANVSWFGLFYPDPDARLHGSFASSHNVFDCRYSQYAPKLDAIAYYNAVNAIAAKKFVTDKTYGLDKHAFLFRDGKGRSLIVAYKDKGREDVFLPLPGVDAVTMIRLDGSRDALQADQKGISLSIGEDPVLLLFQRGPASLPESLGKPAARFASLPARFFREGENFVEVAVNGVSADSVELIAPPFWTVSKTGDPGRFSLRAPAGTQAREADLALLVREKGALRGLLDVRRPVAGALEAEILPIALGDKDGPGFRLVLKNNCGSTQNLNSEVQLTGQQVLKDGAFSEIASPGARIAGMASGQTEVAAGQECDLRFPLSATQPLTVYHIRATVRDASGKVTTTERPIAGFVGVPKTRGQIKVDGVLEESDWKDATAQNLGESNQFFGFPLSGRPAPVWKGPADLSAQIRYLWDEENLYVAVSVKDDIAGPVAFEDAELWRQDGLQFLIDPARREKEKPGKYEYSIGLGKKGPQTWCTLSADAGAPTGDVRDVQTAIRRGEGGDTTYELAIPWKRLAPFRPEAGGNLGFTMIVNEDDGTGRDAFLTWFGNAHTKDVDTVGDLILLP